MYICNAKPGYALYRMCIPILGLLRQLELEMKLRTGKNFVLYEAMVNANSHLPTSVI
jgi:hypothetical protein